MPSPRRTIVTLVIAFALLYGAYAAFVSYHNGTRVTASIVAGTSSDGAMYYHCDAGNSTPGACVDVDGHAQIRAALRDRVDVRVSTDDGRRHSHDFRLMGTPYMLWPAGIEMELEKPSEQKSFTAWRAGEYRIVCELPGHEERGMWGTLAVG
jgi:hypothetical protein